MQVQFSSKELGKGRFTWINFLMLKSKFPPWKGMSIFFSTCCIELITLVSRIKIYFLSLPLDFTETNTRETSCQLKAKSSSSFKNNPQGETPIEPSRRQKTQHDRSMPPRGMNRLATVSCLHTNGMITPARRVNVATSTLIHRYQSQLGHHIYEKSLSPSLLMRAEQRPVWVRFPPLFSWLNMVHVTQVFFSTQQKYH